MDINEFNSFRSFYHQSPMETNIDRVSQDHAFMNQHVKNNKSGVPCSSFVFVPRRGLGNTWSCWIPLEQQPDLLNDLNAHAHIWIWMWCGGFHGEVKCVCVCACVCDLNLDIWHWRDRAPSLLDLLDPFQERGFLPGVVLSTTPFAIVGPIICNVFTFQVLQDFNHPQCRIVTVCEMNIEEPQTRNCSPQARQECQGPLLSPNLSALVFSRTLEPIPAKLQTLQFEGQTRITGNWGGDLEIFRVHWEYAFEAISMEKCVICGCLWKPKLWA